MKKNSCTVFLCFLVTSILTLACQRDKPQTTFYHGINERDTARLRLSIIQDSFYGEYEVRSRSRIKKTGEVRGTIKGDTLLGDYYYKPYGGGVKKRVPFALLQKGSELLLGQGVVSSFMGIPFFVPNIPINYDNPEFVLVKTN